MKIQLMENEQEHFLSFVFLEEKRRGANDSPSFLPVAFLSENYQNLYETIDGEEVPVGGVYEVTLQGNLSLLFFSLPVNEEVEVTYHSQLFGSLKTTFTLSFLLLLDDQKIRLLFFDDNHRYEVTLVNTFGQ